MDFDTLLDPRRYVPDGPASEIATPGILEFLGKLYDGVQTLARPMWLYGDGSDGAHVVTDGELIASGAYTDYTIPDSVTAHLGPRTDSYPVVVACTGTCRIAGTIAGFGADAIKSKGGSGALGWDQIPAWEGGSPIQRTSDGQQGDGQYGYGGGLVAGGDGGAGSVGSAGSAGVVTAADRARARFLLEGYPNWFVSTAGSGGGDETRFGGGSGGAGGWLFLFARAIVFESSNVVDLHGGDGADGGWSDSSDTATGPTGDCGGGGGGAGGFVIMVSGLVVGTPNNNLAGGAGGAHTGTGTDGAPGDAGFAVALDDRG